MNEKNPTKGLFEGVRNAEYEEERLKEGDGFTSITDHMFNEARKKGFAEYGEGKPRNVVDIVRTRIHERLHKGDENYEYTLDDMGTTLYLNCTERKKD